MRKLFTAALLALGLGVAAPAAAQTVPALSAERLSVGVGVDYLQNTGLDAAYALPDREVRLLVPVAYKLGKLSSLTGFADYTLDASDFSKSRFGFGIGLRVRVWSGYNPQPTTE